MESPDVDNINTNKKKKESNEDTDKKRSSNESDEPKPRIVMTFRPEKPGNKSSNMKIVSTEEKHEEGISRRSTRARCNEAELLDEETNSSPARAAVQKCTPTPSESDEATSEIPSSMLKRSTRRRSNDNVLANAIARKEKSYESNVNTRPSRRIKPTAKLLANKELRIGLVRHNDTQIAPEKTEGRIIQTRRSARRKSVERTEESIAAASMTLDNEGTPNKDAVAGKQLKKKHLGNLGLKEIGTDESMDTSNADEQSLTQNSQSIIDDNEEVEEVLEDEDQEIPEDTSDKSFESEFTSDDEFVISQAIKDPEFEVTKVVSGKVRRSPRKSLGYHSGYPPVHRTGKSSRRRKRRDSDKQEQEEISEPENYEHSDEESEDHDDSRRRSLRKRKLICYESDEFESMAHIPGEPASPEQGSEQMCPEDETRVVGTCYCETPSNVYVAPADLEEPVFCRAVETVDGTRVGCSHAARRDQDVSVSAMLRAGPRAPYSVICKLHARLLYQHMCCPACSMFCTQGTFYQCSEGHLFHLECGLPYGSAKTPPGCPHCGIYSYRWQPVNLNTYKVTVDMKCSNKRVFLPEQREQNTQAYLSFTPIKDIFGDQAIIPEDLLPSAPIDLKTLCTKLEPDYDDETLITAAEESLVEAITSKVHSDMLIPRIMSVHNINKPLNNIEGGSYLHVAARSGNVTAAYLLHYARATLDLPDTALHTPLMVAILALAHKPKISEKIDTNKKDTESDPKEISDSEEKKQVEITDSTDLKVEEEENELELKKEMVVEEIGNEMDLLRVIRYLIAAGADVNVPGPDGMTALHLAARDGCAAACAVLLAAPADVHRRDSGGWTPLVWAAEHGHADVVRLLVQQSADADCVDTEGHAAIHWAALSGNADTLTALLNKALLVDVRNPHGDTALHVAAQQGHYASVSVLLARGARTDIENSLGQLAVEVCTGECQTAISLHMQITLAAKDPKRAPSVILSGDISNGKEMYPIPCINDVDAEPAPTDFVYVTRHVMPQHIYVDNSIATTQGCECKDKECADPCACSILGVKKWYSGGRLLPSFPVHEPPMLFECNHTCSCNPKVCTNSVVTRALHAGATFVRCAVYRTLGQGWGLRSTAPIPRGAPALVYCGELLTLEHADGRTLDHYMFCLDLKPDLLEQCSDKNQLCVDAAHYGSAARFINHSCRPNLTPVKVFTHTRDLRLPTIVLFAISDIKVNEELTFDYGDKFWSVKSKFMRCECGSPYCRYPVIMSEDEPDT